MKKTITTPDYCIRFGSVSEGLNDFLSKKRYTNICVLVDDNTSKHCLPHLEDIVGDAHIITIASGESNKSIATCELIWSKMAACRMDRHSLLINLGGGVIGDMGGFAASCYMRGIDFIQIPTTLLSQVDASVGGKLAVDFGGFKNLVGLFKNPKTVLIDPDFLNTLSVREIRSGYAEMIKHGLIKDKNIWSRLGNCDHWRELNWNQEIFDSVLIKKEIVEKDPFEKNIRKILNFGHTIGHAIESLALQSSSPLLHGEAIGLGMMAEVIMSRELTGLSADRAEIIINYIKSVYADIDPKALTNAPDIINLMQSDKKNKGGKILFSLLKEIGNCTYDIPATDDEIVHCLQQVHKTIKG